jgi:peptidoglycan/LPS O-acetylase OafA/YrhL
VQYRADIDGLRAVAVTSVVAYHAEVAGVSGGFVGVDIFFVISGFLITSLIIEDLERDRFSLAGFWARRARRILPALAVVLVATLAVGAAIMLPADFGKLTDSALATVLFGSNIYFWQTTSYFGDNTDLIPLLHTWSLAVEEQYYLLFPLIMLVAFKVLRRPGALLVAMLVASFALAVWAVNRSPEATFYLSPTRFWELLLGSVLALGVARLPAPQILREIAGIVGIALIAWSVFAYDETTPFPGQNALWPCLGAVLIIWAQTSAVNRVLRLRPLVFIGLISYSLYLWHWPVIVFARYEGLFLGTAFQSAAVILISLVLAILSWRLVEVPSKAWLGRVGNLPVLRASAIAMATFLIAGFGIARSGYATTGSPEVNTELGRTAARAAYGEGECFFSSDAPISSIDPAHCLRPDPQRPSYLLIGDSLAAHLWPGLRAALPNENLSQLTFGGCPPFESSLERADPGCRKVTQAVLQSLASADYDVIIVAARWKPTDLAQVEDMIKRLKQSAPEVVLVGPMVEYRRNLPDILKGSENPTRSVVKYRTVPTSLDTRMRTLAEQEGVDYVSLIDLMCRGDDCLLFDPAGQPIQWDNTHLTPLGSVEIMDLAVANGEIPLL